MSDGPRYQIIAIAPASEAGRSARQVQIQLEEAFDLDLASVLGAFMGGGVCIYSSTDLAAAKGAARKASRLGAEVMVLDDLDNVLADSRTRTRGRPTQATRPMSGLEPPPAPGVVPGAKSAPGTEMVLIPEKEARPDPTYRPPAEIGGIAPSELPLGLSGELESKAESAYMAPPGQDGVKVAPTLEAPPRPARRAPLDAQSPDSLRYDSLEVDDLVSLDGGLKRTREDRRGPSADAFSAPPLSAAEERELELDDRPLPAIEEMVAEDDESFAAGVGEDGMVAISEAPGEEMEVDREPPRTPSPLMMATTRAASRAVEFASGGAEVVVDRAHGGVELLKSLFAEHRRLRIVLGFLIALVGGGVYPVLHAQSAYGSHFRPLTQELSNAEALEARGDEVDQNRTPDAVKSRLWALKLRYFGFTAVLWTVLAGLLAFIWFRIT